MSNLRARVANTAWRWACEPARRRLAAALQCPQAAQRAALQRILLAGAESEFVRKSRLHPEMTPQEYSSAVPVRSYENHLPEIGRMMQGESDVLCAGRPLAFERSSGTTAAAKYIPFTNGLRHEFQEAVRAWMGDLFARHPSAMRGPAWWLISPLRREPDTAGGIPVGLPGDDEYLGPLERRMASWLWAVPPAISSLPDLNSAMDWTLRYLLQTPGLRLISVWNPSFLRLLWLRLLENPGPYVDGLARGTGPDPHPQLSSGLRAMPERAARLRHRMDSPQDVWPDLAVISAWADAGAARDAAELTTLFPGVRLQPKGLLSTEGVVTIPWQDDTLPGIPALHSHFLEFTTPDGCGPVQGIHELTTGNEYRVILTTGGGLWRYLTGDLVRAESPVHMTPRLRFMGRADGVVDLRGEKLHPRFVEGVLGPLIEGFYLLAPDDIADPPRYVLHTIQHSLNAAVIDTALMANPHYQHARTAGQLGQVRIANIRHPNPAAAYLKHVAAIALRAGPVKSTVLHREDGWDRVFNP